MMIRRLDYFLVGRELFSLGFLFGQQLFQFFTLVLNLNGLELLCKVFDAFMSRKIENVRSFHVIYFISTVANYYCLDD